MIASLHHTISQHNLILESKDSFVVTVSDELQGITLAKDILYQIADKKTTLFLSGGRTPKELYEVLAREEKLAVGAVGLIDERYGPPALAYGNSHWRAGKKLHLDSNEWMIQQTGLLGYLKYKNIPFYPILQDTRHSGDDLERSVEEDSRIKSLTTQYDETLRFLFNGFQKSIGILGIGLDGHIAGLPINTSLDNKDQALVTSFTDFPGPQKERISMTFLGLSMFDFLLVLVFGNDKLHALQAMFAQGNEEEIPARFFKRPDIAQKTLIITDLPAGRQVKSVI